MKLTPIGCGTMMPSSARRPSSYYLHEVGTNSVINLLLDCGHTTIASLIDMNIAPRSISTLLITHLHTDHFADVVPFIHSLWVDNFTRSEKLPFPAIMGPEGIKEAFRIISPIMLPEFDAFESLQFIEGIAEATVESVRIRSFPVNHAPPMKSVAFEITAGGKTVVYTGDLGREQSDDFLTHFHSPDLLLIEAGTGGTLSTHLTPREALSIAAQCEAKRVMLTHISQGRVPEVRDAIAGNRIAILAARGQTVAI